MSTATAAPTLTHHTLTHHTLTLDDTTLHYVSAGTAGTPVLLVHGFPETWWAFHRVIPLLAADHRVVAVDLPGFGDSSPAEADSAAVADILGTLITHLGHGPVHLVAQDIAGAAAFRLAAQHPDLVATLTAIEMGLAGFGLEALADVTHGGSWHIGVLAAPGIGDLLFTGRERALLRELIRGMSVHPDAITDADLDELTRTYRRAGAWRGAAGLYRSMLTEGPELRALAATSPLRIPVLAVGAGGGTFTVDTLRQVTEGEVAAVQLDGTGHYAALEAPEPLARAIRDFLVDVAARP